MTSTVKIVSYNVNGINHVIKRKKILTQLKRLNCTIGLLQETHLNEEEHAKLKREWVGQIFSASYEGLKKRGVAILCHKSFGFVAEKVLRDKGGRWIIVIGSIGGIVLTIMNIYAPNEDNPGFFKELAQILAGNSKGIIILGGDFNCVLNRYMDKFPFEQKYQVLKSIALKNMLEELGLVDVWRVKNPKVRDYTHFSRVHKSHSRIDFFFVSKQEVHRVLDCHIEPQTISDHGPVLMSLNIDLVKPLKLWRLNVSLLNSPEMIKFIKDELEFFLDTNDSDLISPSILWDTAKAYLRGRIISFSSKIKKEREADQEKLYEQIRRLETAHKRTNNDMVSQELKKCRQDLNDLLNEKAEGALRFANQKYYEQGNKGSRVLAFQLRKMQANRTVQKVTCPSANKLVSHPREIANAFSEYYKQLYDSVPISNKTEKIKQFLQQINLTKLNEIEAKALVETITEEEIKFVIGKLKNNKSPGADGFPGEFYKHFQEEITPLLHRVFNYALRAKDPPKTWAEAIISVIHKEGKEPTQCASYRPISLLCNDVKILSAVIARRLQKIINKIINPDQTGFIPKRLGINNIRQTLNIISTGQQSPHPSMLLGLDAEKAFDRVDWMYLKQVLLEMGFEETFIKWFEVLYSSPFSRVRVNGYLSENFPLKRGTRQGCCLSPILFAISIEPLAELIRSDPSILGISDKIKTHKLSMYADDVILYIRDPIISIPNILKCLKDFSLVSGYKVNESKSEAMMIKGRWPSELSEIVKFNWSPNGFRYLGINITTNTSQLYEANYGKILDQIKKDLNRWEILPLSLFGRVETVKMNVLPRLLYLFMSLPIRIPAAFFKKMQKMISTFIWQKRKARIKFTQLTSGKAQGGLNLPNLKLYYWAAQMRGMLEWLTQNRETTWLTMEQSSCPRFSLQAIAFCSSEVWNKYMITNVWMKCTQKIFSNIRKSVKAPLSISRAMRIVDIIDFLPGQHDPRFRDWENRNLRFIDDLFEGETLMSFGQLQGKYGLTSTDFYRFLQIRSYLMSHKEWSLIKSRPTDLEMLLIEVTKERKCDKMVSSLYKSLQSCMLGGPPGLKERWELEMNVTIEDREWELACENNHKLTSSPMWKEFSWKVNVRYFRTPYIISKYDKAKTNLCWRQCGQIGDHTHIFWDCPKIKIFWEGVREEISNILQIFIEQNPLVFVLGVLPNELLSKEKLYLLGIMVLVAKKLITVCWYKPSPPTVNQWKERLVKVYAMEKITAKLNLTMDLFRKRWKPLTTYLELTL